ncbi:hypothetical protein GGI15_003880 [Coemansia interrupta]|uniref:J domain-containing protein n=1 Tax=Coemansia interrupta TaxID=1126814 RepID=A0A9W8H5G0_9FUNG|nr:hypothetical protein GGI15_003880 [Coemansia interrupta]
MHTTSGDISDDEAALRDLEQRARDADGPADHYGVLNVARSASGDDVRDAYRRLSRLFHPDRHQSAERRQWAQQQFHAIQRAYEVLGDAAARAAYDVLGDAGVGLARSAVGHKVETARDLQARFEREARRQRVEDIEQLVQSRSEAVATVSCVGGLRSTKPQQLALSHSFAAALGDSATAVVAAHMFARGGRGSGNVTATVRRPLGARTWVSLGAPLLPPHVLTLEAGRQLRSGAYASAHVTQAPRSAPAATLTLSRMLTDTTTAALTVRTGNQYARAEPAAAEPSGVALLLSGKHGAAGDFRVEAAAGLRQSHVTAKYTHAVDAHLALVVGATLTASAYGLHDVACRVGVRAAVSEWTTAGWRVDFGLASGVVATLHVRRLGHRLRLPLVLAAGLDVGVVAAAALAPLAVALAVNTAVVVPRRRRLVRRRLAELRDEQLAQLHLHKRRAEEAARLMAPQAERSQRAARAAAGLVIERALYGDLPFAMAAQNSNAVAAAVDAAAASRAALACADQPRACDVTVPLAALVAADRLVIAAGASKRFLPGFYDPAFGAPKALFVRYSFRGAVHEVVVRDDEALAIPLKAHSLA